MMEIANNSSCYKIIRKVAEDKHYRLYLCEQKETGQQCLLQIAITIEYNEKLQRAAYALKKMEKHADDLEREFGKIKNDPEVLLNYQLGFPELVDSFVYKKQGNRQINIFAFRNVEKINDMVPLINITTKDRLRVDLRTSAWIMGKILKMLDFAHSQGISGGKNILIDAEQHYVIIFDWTEVQTYEETISREIQCHEISQAANAVIVALGGNVETGIFPDSGCKEYTDYLLKLARGNINNTERAHKKFYEIVDQTWKREFYPFTAKPLGLRQIKEMEE